MAQVLDCDDLLRALLGPKALRRHVDTFFGFVRTAAAIAGDSTAASYFSAMASATAWTMSACVCLVLADGLCSRSQLGPRRGARMTTLV